MTATLIALVLFLFPLAYSPGPGNMVFAANGARFGFRATLPASLGYHLATWAVTAAIGLGFFTFLDRAPALFVILKIAGSLYVLWLAWTLFRAGRLRHEAEARPAGIVDGAVLLVLNPKAYVIIALMFSQFLAGDGAVLAVVWIATTFTLNNLVAFSVWTFAGDRIAARFRSPSSSRHLNRVFGALLAVVALWMLVI